MASQEMSRYELLEFVRQLPEKTPIATALNPRYSAKQTWIEWLSDYHNRGDRNPLRAQRDARFIYARDWNPDLTIWLAEASGLDQERVKKAAKTLAASSENTPTLGATIRRILPWHLVAQHLREEEPTERQDDLGRDLDLIRNDTRSETTRLALVDARLGQGQFRADLEQRWNGLCAVTGCGAVLQASHIKPWADCNNQERLDPANGLLLCANIHALFDSGLVSFDDHGHMLISRSIPCDERRKLGLPKHLTKTLNGSEAAYLAEHRRRKFQP
jgi:predicted restriction endonuclease